MGSVVQSAKMWKSSIGIQKENKKKVENENAKHVKIGDAITE